MEKLKFKVGDLVRVLPRKPNQKTQYPEFTDEMLTHVGQTFEISSISSGFGHLHATIHLEEIGYYWHEDWLEKVTKIKVTRRRV